MAIIAAVALAVSTGPPDAGRVPGRGVTDRTSFLLVHAGRSPAEVRAALGSPRATRPSAGARAGSGECWVYGARSGRALTYELCFTAGLLRTKAILPHAVGRDRAVRAGASGVAGRGPAG